MKYWCILIFLLGPLAFAKPAFIKSLKADVLAESKMGSTVVATLQRGTEINEVSREGTFAQVEAGGKKGFLSTLFISDKPLLSGGSLLNQEVDITSKARKRASGFTSAAAARGLKESSDDVFKELGDADFESLAKMENQKVSAENGLDFLNSPEAIPEVKEVKKEKKR